MKKIVMIITATMAMTATPVLAQEKAPFEGAYIGVDAGWGRVAGGNRISGDGFLYGASLGYNVASGPVRFGPELKFADSTQKVCRAYPTGGTGATECQRSDRDLYAGVKLGYVATDKVMIFGQLGYTNVRLSDRLDNLTIGPVKNIDSAHNHNGFRLGGGIEYEIIPRFYLSGAYQYSMWKGHIHQNGVLAGVGFRF